MTWTNERVETLRRLWAQGKSASEIAAILTNVSRNAVIGKAHRLGLSGRPSPIKKEKNESSTNTKSPKKQNIAPVKQAARSQPPAKAPLKEVKVEVPLPTFKEKRTKSTGRGATIYALNERMCKWPEGDPKHPDFHFCGKSINPGQSYCAEHAAIAYQPARRRDEERKIKAA